MGDTATLMDTDMVTMDTIMDTTLAKDLLMLNLRLSPMLKLNPLLPPSPDTVTDTVMVMDMVIPLLTDTTDTMLWARDLLNPAMVILMLMVMVIVTMVIMDTPMAMASKFILLT